MTDPADESATPPARAPQPAWKRVAIGATIGAAVGIGLYFVAAYVLAPALWERYAHRHPALGATPGITLTGDDHPGDPINVALIGSEENLKAIMQAAGWFVADSLGLRSDVKIAADTVLERPYDTAPVSNLFLWGRKEDLAFEQPVGDDPRQRHHVRFWKSSELDAQGRPLWAGSVTYDRRVGLSYTTGQITHHIGADVDAERDRLFAELRKTGDLTAVETIAGFHQVKSGTNGGGDPWHTDGGLAIGTIRNVMVE
jgi:hypothetical protein